MSDSACPYCWSEVRVEGTTTCLEDDRELEGFAWFCPNCGAQGPVMESEEMVTNSLESRVRGSAFLVGNFFPKAAVKVAETLRKGAATQRFDDWHKESVKVHLSHVEAQLFCHEQGDQEEPHLAHLATRALMALEMDSHEDKAASE